MFFYQLIDALKVVENAKMKDYEADEILGDEYVRRKTPYQRWRDGKISENERAFVARQRTIDDVRKFLETSSTLMEPDVSKQIQMLIITSIHKSI